MHVTKSALRLIYILITIFYTGISAFFVQRNLYKVSDTKVEENIGILHLKNYFFFVKPIYILFNNNLIVC